MAGEQEGRLNERKGENEIKGVAVLDLTGTTALDLSNVSRISGVATILVPESLVSQLMSVPMEGVAAVIPIPEGAHVKVQTGQIKMTGEALANPNGSEDETLVLSGQIVITTKVEKVGYKQLIVSGQVLAPVGSETALGSGITRLMGQVLYYSGTARFFNGEDRFQKAFFELLDSPVSMILNGSFTVDDDVSAELLKAKVSEILLNGELKGRKAVIPLLQFLTTEKNGVILPIDAPEDAPRGDG